MGAVMAIIMLGFMWGMYPNRRANLGIVAGAVIVFTGALWLVRSQDTVGDVAYMKAMTGHQGMDHQGMNHAGMMQPSAANPYGPDMMKMHERMMAAKGDPASPAGRALLRRRHA